MRTTADRALAQRAFQHCCVTDRLTWMDRFTTATAVATTAALIAADALYEVL